MNARRLLFVGLGAALVLVVAREAYRRQPAVQIPLVFARLEEAFRDKDASGVMACVHPSYPLTETWPQLLTDPAKARGDAQRILAQAFFISREEPITAEITASTWTLRPDGTAEVRINLAIQGGVFSRAVPPLSSHRFLVQRASWLTGAWAITGHDPIAANLSGF